MNLVTEDDVEELAERIDSSEAEAIFLSCGDMATLGVVDKLEQRLGKPVVTSVQATFWGALRAAGVEDKIEGCGRLLAEHKISQPATPWATNMSLDRDSLRSSYFGSYTN